MVSLATPVGAMRPPPTPLSQRPTLGLKRDSSFLDTDDEHALSSTTKKLKVAFSPNVDTRIIDDWSEKSFDLVKEEVRTAIERHLAPVERRDETQYTRLVQVLSQDAASSEAASAKLIKKYLLALEARVSVLGECGKLVMAVLDISWLGRDETFVALYLRFMGALASAQSKYQPAIMEKLVSHFAKLPASTGRLPEEMPVPRTKMFARLHMAISSILQRTPSTAISLARVLKLEYPTDLETTRSYIQYQRHLLRVTDYVPELKAEILALIVQRLVSIDVQIQQDLEDLEEEAEERLLQRPSSKDGNDEAEESDDSDVDSVSSSEETSTEQEQRLKELRLKVAKMDATLDLLFDYYTPFIEDGEDNDKNPAYLQLLSHFSTFILPNRTRHAQFLLFHFAQTSTSHIEDFSQQCINLAFGSGNSNHRFTALAYLSSFFARGSHIPAPSVKKLVKILCTSLDGMRHRYEPACRGPDRRTYSLYYAVSQALLYIFCFRWRDLVVRASADGDLSEDDMLAEGQDLAWLPGLKECLQGNIYCRMNPLKVCSPAIVGEFAKIAHHLRFLYVFPKLEVNKRLRLGQASSYYGSGVGGMDVGRRETAWDRKAGEAHHQLEAYFPFDPYHLPKSRHWVADDYNEWKSPAGMRRDDDENETYSESDSEYESDEESVPDELGEALVPDAVSVSS